MKFLGIDIYYNLTSTNRVNKIVTRMQQKVNMLRHPKTKITLKPYFNKYTYKTMADHYRCMQMQLWQM